MKSYKISLTLLYVAVLCALMTACDDDDKLDIEMPDNEEEVDYYDYSEKGFFMNGEIKVVGDFECDSIIDGYAKYVKRNAHYRTKDGVEHEIVLGYGLVVELDDYAKFYSDDIAYNADSTRINCNGELMLLSNEETHLAAIEAQIDSIGKPHLITCSTTMNRKQVMLQFRQTYPKSPYSEVEWPDPDDFSI